MTVGTAPVGAAGVGTGELELIRELLQPLSARDTAKTRIEIETRRG
jgi:hypothetical protein